MDFVGIPLFGCAGKGEHMKDKRILTFQELKKQIQKTIGVWSSIPTAKALKNLGSKVVAYKEIRVGSRLSVYECGFALYETVSGSTVLRVDHCGDYRYFTRFEELSMEEESYEVMGWYVCLILEGEDRLVHNQNVRLERSEMSYSAEEMEWGAMEAEVPDPLCQLMHDEQIRMLFSILTEHQKLVVSQYYLYGYTLQEIADSLGVSVQAVSCTLNDAKKKLQKNQNLFF